MKSILFALAFLPAFSHADELKLKTPRGAEISVSISAPADSKTLAPALVIAPGQGYHMDLPLVKDLAARATKEGFIVYRFNWNYFTSVPKGKPSDGNVNEQEDMLTVINYAKKDLRVDQKKILIAGKSLGTEVSYALFAKDPSITGLLLLTPICTDPDTKKAIGSEEYPQLAAETRAIAMVLGNNDMLCSVPMLYDFLKDTKGNVSVDVFGGGHSLTFGEPGDPNTAERDARNIEAAVSAASQWARILVGK